MKKRALHPLVVLVALVLSLSLAGALPAQAESLTLARGQTFPVTLHFSTQQPATHFLVPHGMTSGLSLQSASGTGLTNTGGLYFTAASPVSSGTISLTFMVGLSAQAQETLSIEGVLAIYSDDNREQAGTGQTFTITVTDAPQEETWPDTWTVVTPPTHDLPGEETQTSSLGNERTREIPALGHAWGEWTVVTKPTLTAPGLEERVCATDPAHKESRPIPQLGDTWHAWQTTTPATCDAPGERRRVHTADASIVQTEAIPALGHAWGAWMVVTKPTLTAPGMEQRVCAHDPAHKESRAIPQLGDTWHDWRVVIQPTCDAPGERQRVHAQDSTIFQAETLPALGHDWGRWHTIKEPTCTEPGRERRICAHDSKHRIYRELAVLAHQPGEWQAHIAPTYSQPGQEVVVCAVGGEVLETRAIPALPLPQGPIVIHTGSGTTADERNMPRAIPLDLSRDGAIILPLFDQYGVAVGSLLVTLENGQLLITREMDPLLTPDNMVLVLHPLEVTPTEQTVAQYAFALDEPIDVRSVLGGESSITLMLTLGSQSGSPAPTSAPAASSTPASTSTPRIRTLTTTLPQATSAPGTLNVGDLFLTSQETREFETNIALTLDVPITQVKLQRSLATQQPDATPAPTRPPQTSAISMSMESSPLNPTMWDEMITSLNHDLKTAMQSAQTGPGYEEILKLQQETSVWTMMVQRISIAQKEVMDAIKAIIQIS